MENRNHEHAEAFMLMNYKCEKCGEIEIIWNSRDGITPYMVKCHSCKGRKRHVLFDADKYKPDHKLKEGQRYFYTPTLKEVAVNARKVYKDNKDIMGERTEKDWVEQTVELYRRRPGEPAIKVYIEKG